MGDDGHPCLASLLTATSIFTLASLIQGGAAAYHWYFDGWRRLHSNRPNRSEMSRNWKHRVACIIRHYSGGKLTLNGFKYSKSCTTHMYRNLYPWKTREEFANHLIDSIVYHKDGLIGVNKPYGVAVDRSKEKGTTIETLSSTGAGHCVYSLQDVLPHVQRYLNLEQLLLIKSPERYTSGIMLLACNEAVKEKIGKALRRAKSQKVLPYKYWAVTTCIPTELHTSQKVGIRLVTVKEFNEKVPIIKPNVSDSAIKRQILKPAMTKTTVRAVDGLLNTALVEVVTTTNIWHFVRVFLAYKLSPILGDGLYAPRVKMVLGKPVSVSPFNRASYVLKPLPTKLCNSLQLTEKSCLNIPTHLHLKSVTLPSYIDGEDLNLTADPPEHYVWTLKQLNLLPEDEVITENAQSRNNFRQ